MVAFILPANSATGGYEIDNSLRFNDGDSPSMTIASLGSSSSNAKKWTVSFWAKLSSLTAHRCVFSAGEASGGEYVQINFTDEDKLQLYSSNSLGAADDTATNIRTNALHRDPSAWYHVVWAIDFTDGTAGDRIKLYVNGSRVTSFELTNNIPAQDTDNDRVGANNIDHFIGKFVDSSSEYFDGYLAEFNFIDGDAKAASDFGETNDNGVWIPKAYSGSYGNNGFLLEFKSSGTSQNSSGIGADTSGNDNHFAVSNLAAIDVTTDTPTNNFCTFNPLDNAVLTLSEGNTKATHSSSSGGEENRGTMGFANGKWYWEFQIGYDVPTNRLQPFGVGLLTNTGRNPLESDLKTTEAYTVHWYTDTSNNLVIEKVFNSGTNVTASESYPDNGDIVQFAIDADAGKVWVGKNNTYLDDASGNVGDPANGNYPIHTYTVVEGNFIFPAIVNVGSQGLTILLNTGNPSFAISSGNADANGYGNFEHAPPSGFYSICSKNLAEFG